MARLLTEADVRRVLTMPMALESVEEAFRRYGNGRAILHPRIRLLMPSRSYMHYMAAADLDAGYCGMKIYTSVRGGALRFVVALFKAETGKLIALLEADYLSQMRTGAASGVATRLMAREDSRRCGILGSGIQARTQLEAVAAVRKIEEVRVYSRSPERCDGFCREMSLRLGLRVVAVETSEAAVREMDIVIAATSSSTPVVFGEWLSPEAHINAIGANFPQKRELDEEAVRRCGIIVVDSREQSRLESGDLIAVLGEDAGAWSAVRELADVVTGKLAGRTHDRQVTLFKSNGVAIEDVTVAARVYEEAVKQSLGQHLPFAELPVTRNS
ncbi:MAG TPA: ornithine cyclodeaminase family protein [Candidatus Acidoferrales bacterium]|nr:ornithine cyclodeaminase family protein [Candidatus Acidoferrales bacterium]